MSRSEGAVAAALLLTGRCDVSVASCRVFTGASEATLECDLEKQWHFKFTGWPDLDSECQNAFHDQVLKGVPDG